MCLPDINIFPFTEQISSKRSLSAFSFNRTICLSLPFIFRSDFCSSPIHFYICINQNLNIIRTISTWKHTEDLCNFSSSTCLFVFRACLSAETHSWFFNNHRVNSVIYTKQTLVTVQICNHHGHTQFWIQCRHSPLFALSDACVLNKRLAGHLCSSISLSLSV